MFQKYITEESYFLITNKAVARTSIFGTRHYCERFLFQLRRYVGPLGNILGYALMEDEFCFVVHLKARKAFVDYYIKRQLYEGNSIEEIPDSTYIFSQALANLQSSTAKHFNIREDRSGTLFASRFRKQKLNDGSQLRQVLTQLYKSKQIKTYRKRWRDHRYNPSLERKSWCFNFKGLMAEMGEWAAWKNLRKGLGLLWLERWVVEFVSVLQGRLKKTYFFHKIPFELPFLKPLLPP